MYEKNGFAEVRRGLMPPFEVIYYYKSLNQEKTK
jgi:hypothetical protein